MPTPYDYMLKLMPEATEAQRRTRLGTFGFGADKADTKRAESCRAARRRGCCWRSPPSTRRTVLILDEPTNHLDVDSREALIHALMNYNGAVILISHDRHLIEATADRLWLVRGGTVKPYDGDMESYRALLLEERRRADERAQGRSGRFRRKSDAHRPAPPGSRTTGRACAAEKGDAYAQNNVWKSCRKKSRRSTSAGRSRDLCDRPGSPQYAAQQRGQVSKQLADAEGSWLAATDAYEQASAD